MIQAKEPNLSGYGFYKILTLVFFFLYIFNVEGNFNEKLPTLMILSQLIAIEGLISARLENTAVASLFFVTLYIQRSHRQLQRPFNKTGSVESQGGFIVCTSLYRSQGL